MFWSTTLGTFQERRYPEGTFPERLMSHNRWVIFLVQVSFHAEIKASWCFCSKMQQWGMNVEGTDINMDPSARAAALRQNYFTLMRPPKSVVGWQHRAAQGLTKRIGKGQGTGLTQAQTGSSTGVEETKGKWDMDKKTNTTFPWYTWV